MNWTPSTDNIGVTGYDVYMNSSTNKVGSTGTPVAHLIGLTCGNGYVVYVVAYDAAGNRSGAGQTTAFTAPCAPTTWAETTGGVAHTWTNYTNAGGTEGPTIGSNQTVQIACKLGGFQVADGNTWWYRIAQSPWNGQYYVSADAFYNNGATSGSLHGTPFVDPNVANC